MILMLITSSIHSTVSISSNDYYGYKHYTLDGKCFYVGIGFHKRAFDVRSRNHKWKSVVKRYGLRIEICVGPLNRDDICEWEIQNIVIEKTHSMCHSHDSDDLGCNFSLGGDVNRGYALSLVTRERLSQALIGHNVSDETRKKISEKLSGITRSLETRRRQSTSHKGKQFSDETRAKMRAAQLKRFARVTTKSTN